MSRAAVFAAVFAALYTAHHLGDHWFQTHWQATTKGRPGRAGRAGCGGHVATLTAVKITILAVTAAVLGLHLTFTLTAAGLAADAATHYWADRRFTLAALARLAGKNDYYQLGAPRPGHDDNPTTGTGAYHLDQAWHLAWIWVAALIIAA